MKEEENRRKLNLPDRRQHTYDELAKRLDEHIEKHEKALEEQAKEHDKAIKQYAQHSEDRLSRFFSKALIAFAVIGLISAGSLFGFGVVLQNQSEASDDIQTQREESIRTACEDTNKRHDDTSAQLVMLADADEAKRKTEAGKAEVRRRRDVTLALIDAISPHQDCDKLVAESVKDTGDEK